MKMVGSLEEESPLKMEQFMKGSGLTILEMVLVHKNGQMAQNTKVIGHRTKQMGKVNLFMPTVMFMKVSG